MLALDYAEGGQHQRAWIDCEEIEPLLKGMVYIRRGTYNVTRLPGFEAVYETKSGLRVVGLGSQRQSNVQTFLQFEGGQRLVLNSDQMAQLRNAIAQGRTALDERKAEK